MFRLASKINSLNSQYIQTKSIRTSKELSFNSKANLTFLGRNIKPTQLYNRFKLYYLNSWTFLIFPWTHALRSKELFNYHVLDLKFGGYLKSVNETQLQKIDKSIRTLKDLKYLRLQFTGEPSEGKPVTDNNLKDLGETITSLPNLEHFDLRLLHWDLVKSQITDEGMKSFFSDFQKLKKMKEFHLMINQSKYVTDQSIEYFTKGIRYLEKLEALTMIFDSCSLSDKSLVLMADALRDSKNLRAIRISLAYNNITDEGAKNLINGISSIDFLEILSLNLSGCSGVTNDSYFLLNEALEKLIHLKKVKIAFRESPNVNKETIKSILQGLSDSENMQDLHFKLGNCPNINDDVIKLFSDFLPKYEYLIYLELSMYNCLNITEEGMKYLNTALINCMGLTRITLNFSGLTQLKENAFCEIFAGLATLKNLNRFYINLSFCKGLTDKTLEHLRNTVKTLRLLKRISFDLNQCVELTDEGVKMFAEGIMNVKGLEQLTISFQGCPKLTDSSLIIFEKVVEALKKLESIRLDFADCPQITDDAILEFEKFLTPFMNLNEIIITGKKHINRYPTGMM